MSTYGRSTTRLTPALAKGHCQRRNKGGCCGWLALVLLALGLATACGGGERSLSITVLPTATATPPPAATTPATGPVAMAALSNEPPDADPIDLAQRYRGLSPDAPRTITGPPPAQRIGQQETFHLIDPFRPGITPITATLRLVTPHAYFYVQDGVSADQADLERAGREFEESIYPTVTEHFGRPWTPGVDNDPRIYLVHMYMPGLGGYFTASDEYLRPVYPYANQKEAIYLNLGEARPGSHHYNALLAHELQHLIHWNLDPTEEAWVNEGLSEIAAELVGGGLGLIPRFLKSPDTQLNTWSALDSSAPHYGASHLFLRYLLGRVGGMESARELLAQPDDGIDGIQQYLRAMGSALTAEQVFADWVIANYLDNPEDAIYGHREATLPRPTPTRLDAFGSGQGSVHQFAADYIEVQLPAGDAVFIFEGAPTVPILPAPIQGGWWSGRGDAIDSTLSRQVDLRGYSSATLRFSTWFDIEEDWDYGYVAVSSDGGRRWRALPGRYTRQDNPLGLAYGPGYTGRSGGVLQEEVDLTPYVGQVLLLRFEYVTDEGTNGPGWYIDHLTIATDKGDLSLDDDRWQARGFQQVKGPLPQRFIVQVIEQGQETTIRQVPLDAKNRGQVRLSGFGQGLKKAVIVIAAATDGTSEPATYRYHLRQAGP